MADKKITALTTLSSASQDDVVLVIDNPGGTPVGKKITVGNLFSNIAFITTTSGAGATTNAASVGGTLTANANAASGVVLSAGKFTTVAQSTSQNTGYQYGILATSVLNAATANVLTEHAAGKFVLDVSNAAALIANTFGAVISVSNTGARAAQPGAFLRLEDTFTSNALSTKYLFSAAVANGAGLLANTSATSSTVNAKVKCQINGVDYWILLATSGA